MKDITTAFLIYLVLFVGTFICGYLPGCIRGSERTMNNIALFGGAMIIGISLIIVMPEATHILINAQS